MLSVIVEKEKERERAEKKNIYIGGSISKSLVFSVLAWMQSDGCTTCARTFFYPLLRRPPPKLFPRFYLAATAWQDCWNGPSIVPRVSCHKDEGAGCGATTVRFRHVANERSRATENEKRIDFRVREPYCFHAEPFDAYARACRTHINLNCSLRDSRFFFFIIEQKVNMVEFMIYVYIKVLY